jgi:hypothetical protein
VAERSEDIDPLIVHRCLHRDDVTTRDDRRIRKQEDAGQSRSSSGVFSSGNQGAVVCTVLVLVNRSFPQLRARGAGRFVRQLALTCNTCMFAIPRSESLCRAA